MIYLDSYQLTLLWKRNNISGNDDVNVLRTANEIINLSQTHSNLKAEIESLQKLKIIIS